MTDYKLLSKKLVALTEGVNFAITNLSNASALIFDSLPQLNWAGFYFIKDGRLILYPFQGKPACTEIEIGKGVCGTAAMKDETLCIDNVHSFEGHIACDGASNSEIVVPLHYNKKVIGVLDIDSPVLNRFSENDREGLEKLAAITERFIASDKEFISSFSEG